MSSGPVGAALTMEPILTRTVHTGQLKAAGQHSSRRRQLMCEVLRGGRDEAANTHTLIDYEHCTCQWA